MSKNKKNTAEDEDSVSLGNPNQPSKPQPLTPEEKEAMLTDVAEILRLNEQQRPRRYPRTRDEEILARLA